MTPLQWTAFVLVVIGGLNWGLVAFDFNLVETLFGMGTFAKVIYGLVGLAALYAIIDVAKK